MVTTRSSLGRSPSPAAGNDAMTSKKKNSDDAMSTKDDDNDDEQPTLADVLPLIQEYLKSTGLFSRTVAALNAETQLKKVKTALEECKESRVLGGEGETLMEVCKAFVESKRSKRSRDDDEGDDEGACLLYTSDAADE